MNLTFLPEALECDVLVIGVGAGGLSTAITARKLSCIDRPTIRREYRSITAAAYSQPSAVQM